MTAEKNKILEELRLKLNSVKPRLPLNFPPDDDFREVWALDSLDLVEFVARIEQHYKISIPDADLEKFTTLNRVVDYVSERLSMFK